MIARILMALIRVYQMTLSKLIRMTLGNVCRFEPSCSRYAFACLRDHGALRGSLLSVKRLCRCHPFHPGGFDPPPPPRMTARALSSSTSASTLSTFPAGAPAPAGEIAVGVGAAIGATDAVSSAPTPGAPANQPEAKRTPPEGFHGTR
jgi:putative membrane protein insertion efficiency factor